MSNKTHYNLTFWSTDRSNEAILISDFLSNAVSLAISAAFDLCSSDILELALQKEKKQIMNTEKNHLQKNLLFQLCLCVGPEHLVSVLLLPIFGGHVLEGGLEDVLVGFEPSDNLLSPLVFSMEVSEGSLDCL